MGRRVGQAAGASKGFIAEPISKQEKKDLKTLANDFALLYREEVQEILQNCKSYAEGQQKIMRVYTAVYL